jgi:hypothetical protein
MGIPHECSSSYTVTNGERYWWRLGLHSASRPAVQRAIRLPPISRRRLQSPGTLQPGREAWLRDISKLSVVTDEEQRGNSDSEDPNGLENDECHPVGEEEARKNREEDPPA